MTTTHIIREVAAATGRKITPEDIERVELNGATASHPVEAMIEALLKPRKRRR